MERELKVRLLGSSREAGAGTAPLPEKDDRARRLGDGGKAKAFRHQGDARARRRGRRANPHVGGADCHVDAGDLVLALDDGALISRALGFQVDTFVGRRADRVIGLHPQSGLELGDAHRLEALDQHAPRALLRREGRQAPCRLRFEFGASVRSRHPCGGDIHLGRFGLASFELVANRLEEQLLVVSRDADRGAQRDGIAHDGVLA